MNPYFEELGIPEYNPPEPTPEPTKSEVNAGIFTPKETTFSSVLKAYKQPIQGTQLSIMSEEQLNKVGQNITAATQPSLVNIVASLFNDDVKAKVTNQIKLAD